MSPETFLNLAQSNVIYAGGVPTKTPVPIVSMRLELYAGCTVTNAQYVTPSGKNFVTKSGHRSTPRAYKLVRSNGGDGGFNAYICNYTENDIQAVYLGSEADFCFTVTLNSCTFGIGSQSNDGVLVTHANAKTQNAGLRGLYNGTQDESQASATRDVIGPNGTLFEKNQYYVNANDGYVYTTVIGVRQRSRWSFYRQTYKMKRNPLSAEFMTFAPITVNQLQIN